MIYKILTAAEWDAAVTAGQFGGSALDLADGYVHLSGADQVVDTAARYFAGQTGLTLLAVDEAALGDALRWEPSRGGALYPHLYAPLPVAAVAEAVALPDDVPVDAAVAAAIR